MDAHTLQLLEFDKIKEIVAGYAATPRGKELVHQLEPPKALDKIRAAVRLVTEMTQALLDGLTPPFGGVRDVRMLVRRAAIGSALTAAELLEVKDALAATGNTYRYRMRLDERWEG